MIGEIVGSYQLMERLGVGGMGEVYRAEHLHLDRQAAIKLLLLPLSSSEEAIDRFFSEARATSLIHHPGIVDVFDCAVHQDGRVYLVMELLNGETLASRLAREGGFGADVRAALDIASSIASALGAAHALGIVHRDLKPENIFLVRSAEPGLGNSVKVLDFGIARLLGEEGGAGPKLPLSHTRGDRILGTPAYMSPEQCRDAHRVDHRTDVYSLGCILFELLSGRTPFVGDSYGTLIGAHLHHPPPDVRSLVPALGQPVASLIDRLLAKNPEDRPPTMAAVEDAIAELQDSLDAPPSFAVSGWARQFRSRWFVTGLASLGCVALVTAAVRLGKSGHRPVAPVGARLRSVAAATSPAAGPRLVQIELAGAPVGVRATVDGRSASLPLSLPEGTASHAVVLRAAGYADLALAVDGHGSRRLVVEMRPLPSVPPSVAPAPARRRVPGPVAHPRPTAPAGLSDEERKL